MQNPHRGLGVPMRERGLDSHNPAGLPLNDGKFDRVPEAGAQRIVHSVPSPSVSESGQNPKSADVVQGEMGEVPRSSIGKNSRSKYWLSMDDN